MYFVCGYDGHDHKSIADKYFAQHKIMAQSQRVVTTMKLYFVNTNKLKIRFYLYFGQSNPETEATELNQVQNAVILYFMGPLFFQSFLESFL